MTLLRTVASAATRRGRRDGVAAIEAPHAVEQVEVGLQVQLGTAGVDPVVVGGDREECPVGDERWNVSRSIDTFWPSGIRASTLGSSTYVPALIRLLGSVPGAGFSTKALDASVGVEVDDAERRRISRPR